MWKERKKIVCCEAIEQSRAASTMLNVFLTFETGDMEGMIVSRLISRTSPNCNAKRKLGGIHLCYGII